MNLVCISYQNPIPQKYLQKMISSGFSPNKVPTNVKQIYVYRCVMRILRRLFVIVCLKFIQLTRMPATRRISQRQLEILLAFAEANKDIALGLCARGGQGNQVAQLAWKTISIKLNAVGDGVTKTGEEWRRYWVEWKSKTKAKGADSRRSAKKTGGGPNKLAPLSEFEERILQLIGPVAVGGLPGVQIPFNVPSLSDHSQPSTSQATEPPSQESTEMEIEWLEQYDEVSQQLLPELETSVLPPSPPTITTTSSPSSQPLPAPPPQPLSSLCPQSLPTAPQPSTSPEQPAVQSVQPAQPSQRRTRQRPGRTRDVPQWVLDLEERRLAIEERHASALESLSATNAAMERRLAGIEKALLDIVDKLGNK